MSSAVVAYKVVTITQEIHQNVEQLGIQSNANPRISEVNGKNHLQCNTEMNANEVV